MLEHIIVNTETQANKITEKKYHDKPKFFRTHPQDYLDEESNTNTLAYVDRENALIIVALGQNLTNRGRMSKLNLI
jgi:hypothetical protein